MLNNIVLVVVITIAIVAHIAIWRWIRFKIDEGVILNFLQSSEGATTVESIAAGTGISVRRVRRIYRQSDALTRFA